MREDLIIIGAGGFGGDVAFLASKLSARWRVVGFLDDDPQLKGTTQQGLPVLGEIAAYEDYPAAKYAIAIGSPRARRAVRTRMVQESDARFPILVDPDTHIRADQEFGAGTIVRAGVVSAVNVSYGRFLILSQNDSIGHDSRFGDFCTVAPLAFVGGHVACGDGVEIGASAAVRQGVTIGRGGMVGMGAVVLNDVAENEVVVGNPARPLRMLDAF